jgi:hypothetical protein
VSLVDPSGIRLKEKSSDEQTISFEMERTFKKVTVGIVETPGAILGDGDHPARVGTEVKAPDARRVATQLESARHLLELTSLRVHHFHHLHIRRETCANSNDFIEKN